MSEPADVNGMNIMMKVPLEKWVREIAEEAGKAAALAVIKESGLSTLKKRVFTNTVKLYILMAFLAGLGVLQVGKLVVGP